MHNLSSSSFQVTCACFVTDFLLERNPLQPQSLWAHIVHHEQVLRPVARVLTDDEPVVALQQKGQKEGHGRERLRQAFG